MSLGAQSNNPPNKCEINKNDGAIISSQPWHSACALQCSDCIGQHFVYPG